MKILEVDQKWKFHFRPKPKVDRKWRNTFGRNRMCHRKWAGLSAENRTESQSCLGRHGYGSQQVAHRVRCPTIPRIWYLSPLPALCQPCGVSLMTAHKAPQYQMQTQTTQPLPRYIVSTQWG